MRDVLCSEGWTTGSRHSVKPPHAILTSEEASPSQLHHPISPVKVTNSDESLESSPLTGRSLLLNRLDAHDLVLEGRQEKVDDLVLSDREREQVDLLHRFDLSVLYKSTKLGNRDPRRNVSFYLSILFLLP
jgi:hypothetical protein